MRKRNPKTGRFEPESGTYVDSKGYLAISAGPLRGMRVHKLVALAKFGKRALARDIVVHHKDGDKTNPHPNNLQLMTESEHNAVSAKQYWYLKTHVWPAEKEEWDNYFTEHGHNPTEARCEVMA
jgi:hypothetical protein